MSGNMFGVIASVFRPRSLRSDLAERGWRACAAERHPLVEMRNDSATWRGEVGTYMGYTWTLWRVRGGTGVSCFPKGLRKET
jgi:hypothetical protein